MSFIYVSSPYTSPDQTLRHKRYLHACYYTASLFLNKKYCYSPVVNFHHFMNEFGVAHDANTWMAQNFAMLSSAKECHVLTLENWEKDTLVLAEINFFRGAKQGFPLYFVDFNEAKTKKLVTGAKLNATSRVRQQLA